MKDIVRIQSITLGYSDSEDRVWVRLILQDDIEARLWLTRRLMLRLAEGLVDMLMQATIKKTNAMSPELELPMARAKLAAEFTDAQSTLTNTPAPPPPESKASIATGICHSVDISSSETYWSLTWRSTGTPNYLLDLDRGAVIRLVSGMVRQADTAGWDFPQSVKLI